MARRFAARVSFLPGLQWALGLALLAGLSVPLLTALPGPLTSDESLYVAEGLNIARGDGYTYTTGELVHHRGPVFPALLAADFAAGGVSLDHAYWIPRLFALGNAALLLLLGWRLFGREAGLLAAGLALASSLLAVMANRLFLDGVQTFFLLGSLLCLHTALQRASPRWAAMAGVSMGLAVLTKESALQWAPLPLLAVLLAYGQAGRPYTYGLLAAYGAGLLGVAGWWWPYVYAVTGQVYLLGGVSNAAVWAGGALACVALIALGAWVIDRHASDRLEGPSPRLRPHSRWLLVGLLAAAWGGLFLAGLELKSGWPFPREYLYNVPDYTTGTLASWVRPLPLIAVAWVYVVYRAARGSLGDRLIALGLVLFLPFAVFVANRGLHVRDMLPLVYLSYLALGRAAVEGARWLARSTGEALTPAVAAGAVVALLLAGFGWFAVGEGRRFSDDQAAFDATTVQQQHWDNPLVRRTAAWVDENAPPGTPIMSGRLYYSQLYVLTDGRYPWWQLPTVRVEFATEPPALERASTLFRWQDHLMPDGPAQPWLYLRRYPLKGYYVALSERDLLAEVREHEIGYVIVTGEDAGFSSLSLLPYFEDHPAFEKVAAFEHDADDQAHIFRVRPAQLELTAPPALVSERTAGALRDRLGAAGARELLRGLGPNGYMLTSEYGAPLVSESEDES